MELSFLIAELLLAIVFIILTMALSERFLEAGIKKWRWMLGGFVILSVGSAFQIAFSVKSFSQLFVPAIEETVVIAAYILRLAGLLIVLISFYLSAGKLSLLRKSDQEKEDRLKLLDVIRETVSQSLSLIEVLNFSIKELVGGTGSAAGCIFIYNPNRQQLILAAHRGLPREMERSLDSVEDTGSILFRAQRHGRAHSVGNITASDKATALLLGDMPFKSLVATPLLARTGSLGVIVLFSHEAYFYSQEEIRLILSAANILGPAVASFRMERELREALQSHQNARRAQEFLDKLIEISSKAKKLPDALQSLFEQFLPRLKVKSGEIYSVSGDTVTPVFPPGDASRMGIDLAGHLRHAVADRKSLLVRNQPSGEAEKMVIIPSPEESEPRRAYLFHLEPERADLTLEEIELIRALIKIIDQAFRIAAAKFPSALIQNITRVAGNFRGIRSYSALLSSLRENLSLFGLEIGNCALLESNSSAEAFTLRAAFNGREVISDLTRIPISPKSHELLLSEKAVILQKASQVTDFVEAFGDTRLREMFRGFSAPQKGGLFLFPIPACGRRFLLIMLGEYRGADGSTEVLASWPIFEISLGFVLAEILYDEEATKIHPQESSLRHEDLNDLNNILTGILGTAQLLEFGLKKESLGNKHQILLNLDKIADEAYHAGQLVKDLQRKLRLPQPSMGPRTSLDLALKSISAPDPDSNGSIYYLKSQHSIRFDCLPSQAGTVELPQKAVEDLLLSIFAWIKPVWNPEAELSTRLIDAESGIHFVVSESYLGRINIHFEEYAFKPLSLFPDPLIAGQAIAGQSIEFYLEEQSGKGHLLVLRFPRAVRKLPARGVRSLKPRLLAIDDQEVIRELLASMLDELGYSYRIFPDGQSGLDAFENDRFDIVITDLGLPDLSGWEVARKIKTQKPSTPIIIISGWGLETTEKAIPDDCADFILSKPFRMEQLGEMIKAAEAMQVKNWHSFEKSD